MKYIFYLILFISVQSFAQNPKADTLKYCLNKEMVGLGGYDPMSYFEGGKPQLGNKKYVANYEGVEYYFINQANKNTFVVNPNKYLPEFGGWCSMTLAMGRATTPKYDNFIVSDGKLFLFERTLSVNGRELWLKDPNQNKKIATKNYTSFRKTGKIK